MRKIDAKTQTERQILKETAKPASGRGSLKWRRWLNSAKPFVPTGKELLGLFLALLMISQTNLYVVASIKNSDEIQKRVNAQNLLARTGAPFKNSNGAATKNSLPTAAEDLTNSPKMDAQPFFFGEDSKLNSLLPNKVKEFFSDKNKELLKLISPAENPRADFTETNSPENPTVERQSETVLPEENNSTTLDTVVAFGPKRFDRVNGPPNNYRETFSMPDNCVTGTYKLRIKNGEQNGTKRVSSGFVKLNGVEIIHEADFNQGVYIIERPVTLNSQSVLDIRLASTPGSYITLDVVGENCAPKLDTIPPRVIITTPTDNFATIADKITIRGTAEDFGDPPTGINRVLVDGVQVSYNTTTHIWELIDKPLNPGVNAIVVKAVDNSQNETTSQVVIIRDLTAPAINLTSPTNNSVTQAESITLNGSAADTGADASGVVRVTVNGTNAVFDPVNGQWSYPNLPLTLGANTVELKAIDNAGNETPLTVTINRQAVDTQPPTVAITSPANNFTTFDNQITVSGTAIDQGDGATGVAGVTVNGTAASYNAATGQWTATVSLNQGANLITAIATDNATPPHQSQAAEIQVTRLTTEVPVLMITSPANGTFSSANSITVAGTVSSNNPNMALTVMAGGQAATITGGQFSQNIALSEGINTITVTVRDALGQEAQSSVTVTRDQTPPTVSLNVPPNVQPGSSYQIQAEAADAYGVAEVEFLVDGVSMTRTAVAPYQFNYQVPANLPPNRSISISAVARDFSGAGAVATAQTVTTGPSGIVGFVFDDVTGYILPEANAALNSQESVLTEPTGRYSFVSPTNTGFIRISKNGYTSVERIYNSEAGLGTEVFDSRLTPLDAKTNAMDSAGGGAANSNNSRVSAQFASGSFAPAADVRLTEVSPQGLANLLPFGWSPVPGAVVDIRTAPPSISVAFPSVSNLTINQVAGVTSVMPLVLARYDEGQHKWVVVAKDIVIENGTLHGAIPVAGQYAFLVADTGATAPPSAVVGAALPSAAAANSDALNSAVASAAASPRSAVYSSQAKSTITFEANSAGKLPSGVSIEATFDESYTLLLDRSTTFFGRPSQDFVLYSFPAATAETPNKLGAYFIAKPSRTDYGLADLLSAKIHVEIYSGRLAQSGVLIGSNGGTVTADEGAQIEIPTGATNQPQSVFFRRVAVNQTGITLPENYETVAAFDFTQTGNDLTSSARISFPLPSGDNSRIVVAKIIAAGGQKLPKVVARAAEGENNRLVSSVVAPVVPSGVNLEGVISSGRYVFIRVPHAFGYVSGTVQRAGVPNGGSNVRVTTNREPFGDVTRTDAKFVVLGTADANANAISGAAIGSDATGQSTVNLTAQDEAVATTLNLSTVPLQVEAVTPADGASNVIVTAPVTVTFNKPVSGTTITGSNFKLTTASGNPVLTNLTVLAGSRSVVLTPASVLQGSTSYKLTVTNAVKDIYGNPMAAAFQSGFATANIVTAQQRLKPQNIRVSYPNGEGISTVTIPAGSVPEGSVVTVINRTSGSTVSTVVGTQAITLQIQAQVGDEIEVIIRQPDGVEYTVKQSAFRRDDGFYSVGANGGVVLSEDGTILLDIPEGAITGQANIRIYKALESEITAPRTGEMAPSEMAYAGGVKVEVSGNFTNKKELHLELDAPANVAEGQRVMFMSPKRVDFNGQEIDAWETVTSGRIEGGKIKSNSPPFLGVTLAAVIVGLTLLSFFVFIPLRLYVVRGHVQTAKLIGPPEPLPDAYVAIRRDTNPFVITRTNENGDFAVVDPSFRGSGTVTVIAVKNTETKLAVATPYQSTEPSLFGFETRYALVEFDAGSPINQPANLQLEASTLGLPSGEVDPILSGRAIVGSQVKFRVKVTPSVETFVGKLTTNGVTTVLAWSRDRQQGYDVYETTTNVSVPARYELSIESFTSNNNASTRATKQFNFIGVESPTNRPVLPGPPSVISVTPTDAARQIDVGTKIHLEFSEPVRNLIPGTTVKVQEIVNGEPGTNLGGSLSSNDLPVGTTSEVSSVDFIPIDRLKGGKSYQVTVTSDVTDTDVNAQQQPVRNKLDQDAQTTGNQNFTSRFETFQGVVISDTGTAHTGFRITAVEDLLVTTKPFGSNGQLDVYDTSSPQRLTRLGGDFISYYPIGLAAVKDQFLVFSNAGNKIFEKIAVVTTAPVPFTDYNAGVPFAVQIYSLDDPVHPKLIGIVTLSQPRAASETPVNVSIHDKKAFVSLSAGGVAVINLEEAIQTFYQQAYYTGERDETEVDKMRLEAFRSGGTGFGRPALKQKAPYKTPSIAAAPVLNTSAMGQVISNQRQPIAYITSNQPQLISFNFDPSRNGILDFYDSDNNGSDDRVLVRKNLQPTGLLSDVKAAPGIVIGATTKDLVVAVGGNYLWIFDTTNPANPTQYPAKTFRELGLTELDMARQVEVEGTLAYVRFDNKVAVIDISNPAEPYISTVIRDVGDNLRWFTVSDGFIYTLDSVQGIKTSIGRGIAQVLAYGYDPTDVNAICASGVVIDRENRRPQQPVGFFIQIYGQQSPANVKVKIRKITYSGTTPTETLIKTVTGGSLSGTSPNVAVANAVWNSAEDNFVALQDVVYTAEVILDEGKSSELHSKQVEIPFSYLIPFNQGEIGVINSPFFSIDGKQTGPFQYMLASRASVKLMVDGQDATIKKRDDDDVFERGFGVQSDKLELERKPDGRYSYKLRATLKANSQYTDEVEGFVTIGTDGGGAVRKPGSTVVNGVEIGVGNLALSASDLMIKGRGLSLEVSRHYNTSSANVFNPLGYGWRHNYQVALIKRPAGESSAVYTLINSDGSLRNFNAALMQNGVIKVNAPDRGSLVPQADGSFDFFTTTHVKYHFSGALEENSPRIYSGNLEYIEEPNGNRITLAYDAEGRMTQVRDSSNRTLTYSYELAASPFAGATPLDANGTACGNRTKLKELLRRIDQATIGKAWRITKIKSSDGLEIEYAYDDNGNLERVQKLGTDTIGSDSTSDSVWRYEYNPSPSGNKKYDHLIKTVKAPNHDQVVGGVTLNRRTTYEYDLTRPDIIPVSKIIMPEGVENTFINTYASSTSGFSRIEKTEVVDGNGARTTYNFDPSQRLLSMISPRSGTQTYRWTDYGQLRETTDASGVTTLQFYDENQNPSLKSVSGTDAEGNTLTITTSTLYDKTFGTPLQTVDGNQNTTNYRLDAKGNVSRIELPTGRVRIINYYPNGDVLDETDEYGFVTRYTSYDAYGNPKTIQKEAGSQTIITNNTYDARSRLKTTSDTLSPTVSYEYDAFDRIVSQTISDPAGFQDTKQTLAAYLPEGQPIFMQESGGGQSSRIANVYDNLNRIRQMTETVSDYGSITRNFTYDYNSNLITSQDRRGITTKNTYDTLNFLTKVEIFGGTGGSRTVWDASGENDVDLTGDVRKFRDVYGNVTHQQYDAIKRLKSRFVEGFPSEDFEYDKVGNLLSQTDRNGHTTTFAYDSVNRRTRMTDAEGRQTTIEYRDAEKKMIRRLIPQGLVETTSFDALKRPTVQEINLATESAAYRTEYTYTGRSIKTKDPRGNTTVQELSSTGQTGSVAVEGATPAFQTQTRFTAFGAAKSHTDANGRSFTFTVDGFNRTRAASYNGEFSESWDYDGEGLLLSHTDKRGAVTTTTFDNLKRPLEINVTKSGESIRVQKIDYFDSESREVQTDANNHTTTQIFDGLRRVKTVTNAVGDSRTLTYDGENLKAETDWFNSQEKQTRYEYDKVNRPRKITERQGASEGGGQSRLTQILYNDTGGLTRTTIDRRGNRQKEVLDALGRVRGVYVSPALGAEATERVTEYSYDGNDNRTAMTDGVGNTTNYVYDKLNRVQTVNHAGGLRVETYTYEANGNVATYNDGRGGSESYAYDSLDQMKSSKDGASNETKFKYDGEGLLVEKIDPKGAEYKTAYTYNVLGSLRTVTDADSKTWNFTYDAAQNLDTVTDPQQRLVDYDYDALNRLTQVTQPLGLVTNYNEYDKNSNLKRMTDPKGQVVDYTYDEIDRVKTTAYKNAAIGGAQISFEYNYDAENNLTEVKETNSIGQVKNYARRYDARNRLTEERDARSNVVNFVYDAANNVQKITARNFYNWQSERVTNYTYDALNRLDTVSAGNTPVADYNWTADGLLDEVVYQGSAATKRKYGYDNADRVTSITNTIGTGSESFDYGYDANSNRTSETRKSNGVTTRTISYGYDLLDRLKASSFVAPPVDRTPPPIGASRQITEFKRTYDYEYDAVGNRNKETTQETTTTITLTTNNQGVTSETRSDAVAPAEMTNAEFDDLNRLTKTTKGAVVKTFDYDNNGNLTVERVGGSKVRSYEYDNRDQLTKIKGAASEEIASYEYDFERRRLSKFIQGAQFDYSYAGNQVIADYSGNNLFNSYTLGANEVVRAELNNEGARYYYSDALRSTTVLAAGNTATARIEYGALGEIIGTAGASYNSIGFTGQRRDAESGLMPLGNGERYYSPEQARFIQQDSFTGALKSPQTLNRFSYAVNNPFRYKDPTGNYLESAWDLFSLGVGIYSFYSNIKQGNYGSAALDAVGILADTAALLLPVVPGGVGVAIRASRAVAYGVKVLQTVDRAVNIYQAATAAGEEFGKGNYGWGALNTGFALLGAKGLVDSAKGISKIEDFNAGKGTPSYIKEYDSLSKDLEKLRNFGNDVADYAKAFGRGFAKDPARDTMFGLPDPLTALAANAGLRTVNGIGEVVKKARKPRESLEEFLSRGTVTKRSSTDWLQRTVDDWDEALMGGNKYQVHHLLAISEAKKFSVMEKAAELGYNVNRKNNLISLPTKLEESLRTGLPIHSGKHHKPYFEYVRQKLESLQKKYDAGKVTDENLIRKIGKIEDEIRTDLLNGTVKLYGDK